MVIEPSHCSRTFSFYLEDSHKESCEIILGPANLGLSFGADLFDLHVSFCVVAFPERPLGSGGCSDSLSKKGRSIRRTPLLGVTPSADPQTRCHNTNCNRAMLQASLNERQNKCITQLAAFNARVQMTSLNVHVMVPRKGNGTKQSVGSHSTPWSIAGIPVPPELWHDETLKSRSE